MTVTHALLLLAAGLVGGVINSVASGGSFFTYPAMILSGLNPIQAATTTLAALTPGNLAAVPEYWPEVRAQREKYPRLLALVSVGSVVGIVLLLTTGADSFDTIVPWLILASVGLFAISPAVRRWAEQSAPSLTDGFAGWGILFVLSIYMTYFGSGVGNMFLAMLFIRGFGDFLSANAAKNIIMTLGTVFAAVAYTLAGHIDWVRAIPVLIGSAIGARYGARVARSLPVEWIRAFIIVFGLCVAMWQFLD
ncbi:MAG: sulfite exporter TauE/SafE family protein [Acidimicrobiales bacterium]|nr:MAG: sulfite exporter TauE/SafE family protein [Acidimicrobiales bacterium]